MRKTGLLDQTGQPQLTDVMIRDIIALQCIPRNMGFLTQRKTSCSKSELSKQPFASSPLLLAAPSGTERDDQGTPEEGDVPDEPVTARSSPG